MPMSRDRNIILSVILIVALVFVAIFIFSEKKSVEQVELNEKNLERQIVLDDTILNLIIQENINYWNDGTPFTTNTYKFYTTDTEAKLIKEIESQVFNNTENDAEPYFFTKDISGDGVPEIFILMERSASNLMAYSILQWKDNELISIREENTENDWVIFDDIEYHDRSNSVYATWHGNFERGVTQFKLQGNTLIREKAIGLYAEGYNSEGCNVQQVNVRPDQTVSFTHIEYKEKCNIWEENIHVYFVTEEDDLGPQLTYIDGKKLIVYFESDFVAKGHGDPTSGNLIVTSDGKEIWRNHVGGLGQYKFSFKFTDVGRDGVIDVWAHTSGGGNRPQCLEEYHRYTGETFVPIQFVNADGQEFYEVSCEEGMGLNIFNGISDQYTTYEWKKTNEPKDGESPICRQDEIVYQFDGDRFLESSRRVVREGINAWENGIFACY